MKARDGLVLSCLLAVFAAALPILSATAAPQPSDADPDVVVWTVNTGNNSARNCATIGGCNLDKLSQRIQLLEDCPDVVLAQEIRTRSHAVALKRELNQIGGECGVYRQYFFDQDPSDASDVDIAKVAIAWRYDRFRVGEITNGGQDVINHREMWNRVGDAKDSTTCGSYRTHRKDGTVGEPSRYVTAVKLVDQVHVDRALIAASIHWDGAMSVSCTQRNIEVLDDRISARWNGLPVVMGGDHNRKTWPNEDWAISRTESGTKPWHQAVTARGYSDVIRATYSTTQDLNGDGNIDMCEQFTSGIHLDHSVKASNVCSHRKHGRIDYIWIRGLTLGYAVTDIARFGAHARGNYYSDHRPVTTRVSY